MISTYTLSNHQIKIPATFQSYKVINEINKGSFSVIFLVEEKISQQKLAAKIIPKKYIVDKNMLYLIKNEIDILKSINHPNIIKFYQACSISNDDGEEYIVIITEYCKNGDLFDFIYNNGFENEYEKIDIFYRISKAIEYLHSIGIAHCDIKPENILLDENMNPKLCDFGFSKKIFALSNDIISGSIRFSAPELLTGENINFLKADIWALGMTFYFLSVLDFPFNAHNDKIAVFQITNGCLSIDKSDSIHKLVNKCFKMNPDERATIKDILNNEYFCTNKKLI